MLTKLSDTEKTFQSWTRIILLIAIAISGVFLVIFAMLGLRLNSNLSCGIDRQGAHPLAVLDNHTTQLENTTDYILQEFSLNSTRYLNHEFCFNIHCIPSTGAEINIINQEGDVLNTEYVLQGAGRYCTYIKT